MARLLHGFDEEGAVGQNSHARRAFAAAAAAVVYLIAVPPLDLDEKTIFKLGRLLTARLTNICLRNL